jgi:hypothetical protein
LVLLAPVLLYRLLSSVSFRFDHVLFCITAAWAIRRIVLQHLLQHFLLLPESQHSLHSAANGGTTLCRFTVDLKGVLRFLSNEQEAKMGQEDDGGPEVLVTHIILRALGRAMAQQPGLIARGYPLLPLLYNMDMVLHEAKTVKLVRHADEKSIQEIANALLESTPKEESPFPLFAPSCRLWTTPDSDHCQVDLEVTTLTDCPIAVVVSGIRLEKLVETATTLSTSITIQSSNVDACRSFAEQLQQLIQFPEMCNDE